MARVERDVSSSGVRVKFIGSVDILGGGLCGCVGGMGLEFFGVSETRSRVYISWLISDFDWQGREM